MNHDQAAAGDFVGRYLAGSLTDAELERFENHYVDCPACQRALDADEQLRAGFRTAQSAGLIDPKPARARVDWTRPYALAASVLLAVSVGWGLHLQSKLVDDSSRRGARDAADTEIVRLVTARSGDGRPDAVLERRPGLRNWLLDVDVPRECADGRRDALCADGRRPSRPRETEYRLEIRTADGSRTLFASRPQPPLESGAVVFVIPAADVPAGRYRVIVSGRETVAEFVAEVTGK